MEAVTREAVTLRTDRVFDHADGSAQAVKVRILVAVLAPLGGHHDLPCVNEPMRR